jgi:hypothetical protein
VALEQSGLDQDEAFDDAPEDGGEDGESEVDETG